LTRGAKDGRATSLGFTLARCAYEEESSIAADATVGKRKLYCRNAEIFHIAMAR